ncbi:MAG: hypothetical protein LH468_10740 [Nocardioides sp.]|nr:hypothetical protein [Nocardioides sp.]
MLACWPGLDGIGGRYFEDCREAEVVEQVSNGLRGVRGYALDPATAERLWDVSVELLRQAGWRQGPDHPRPPAATPRSTSPPGGGGEVREVREVCSGV